MHRGARLNLFSDYTQQRWGAEVRKIMLSTGVPCPNRLQGGCVYCAAASYTSYYLVPTDPVDQQIAKGKAYLERMGARLFLASFQHETSTAGDFARALDKFRVALEDPDCVGLVISTRPDYIHVDQLARLDQELNRHLGKCILIELGLQSSNEDSLVFLQRHHGLQEVREAALSIQHFPRLEMGAHLILGIPGETLTDMRNSVDFACRLGIGHLKFHHLQIVKGTPLERQYLAAPFFLPDSAQYLDWLCALIPLVPARVVLHRLWTMCKPELLCAPRWGLKPGQLYDRLFQLLDQRNLSQGTDTTP
jgi:uncharacterized protein